ncbi:uncharacterized protein Eint_071070 [Encephalitozoon intestinalis ATCC 50506]|uniref:Uncharacterized protein n=1 Tax=Encephalitozoon intestinalis (strain ATCC 50506) TaxID=876142 RepID=E0S835_ENCIT|nr:uncharacterized protein Eint_071070 [Encephalitozoon intestinalis ATCC 50506]ADM11870.1 hypothetical protein Eint_071070 [Encephalitozoon intestinalis ATCC 50506]UTX45625.1 hypothetical protein GPK93_07g11900 [Encephalitozoon intestinalis]
MPVKEKEEVLLKDIKEDVQSVRDAVVLSDDVSRIDEYNFESLFGIYKNPQQQVVFVRTIYRQLVGEILKFFSSKCVAEAMTNICILEEVFRSQRGYIDIEMSLEDVECINQHAYSLGKKENSGVVREGIRAWNCLKQRKAIRICVMPFPDDERSLMLIEEELEAISKTLDGWEDSRDGNCTN